MRRGVLIFLLFFQFCGVTLVDDELIVEKQLVAGLDRTQRRFALGVVWHPEEDEASEKRQDGSEKAVTPLP